MSKKRIALCLIALGGILCLGAQSEPFMLMLGKTMPVLNAPQGTAIGEIKEAAMVRVLEEKDGYFKVQVEGWIPKPGTVSSAPTKEPSPKPVSSQSERNRNLNEKGKVIIDNISHY